MKLSRLIKELEISEAIQGSYLSRGGTRGRGTLTVVLIRVLAKGSIGSIVAELKLLS